MAVTPKLADLLINEWRCLYEEQEGMRMSCKHAEGMRMSCRHAVFISDRWPRPPHLMTRPSSLLRHVGSMKTFFLDEFLHSRPENRRSKYLSKTRYKNISPLCYIGR
ncbi:hypothetical protein ACLOJK_014127 [Asimina triloba]